MGKIGLIISREFSQRVRKKSFVVTTLLMPLLMVAMIMVPVLIAMFGTDDKEREIIVVDASGVVAPALNSTKSLTFVADSTTYEAALKTHDKSFGFLVVGADVVDNPSNLKLYTREASTVGIEGEIRSQVSDILTSTRIARTGVVGLDSLMNSVRAKAGLETFEITANEDGSTNEKASSSGASMGVAYIGGFMIYMFVLLYGMMVLQGVVEEKSSRIIEVIVSSVKPFELMMGKILGIACVALLQFMLWVLIGVGLVMALPAFGVDASAMQGASGGGHMLGGVLATVGDTWFIVKVLGTFVIFFVGGYLLYASMFAAIGSAVDNVADTQQLQMPVTVPLIIALFAMMSVMQNPHSDAAFWFSIIPLTSPVIMVARIAYGVPVWEYLLSVALLYGSFVGMTYIAAKIYRTGIFMYGKKPTLKELIKWARYKN